MRQLIVLPLLAGLVGTMASADIMPPAAMPKGQNIPCPHPIPGFTQTFDTQWIGLGGLAPYLKVLNSNAVKNQFTGDWSYVAGPKAVNGNLVVNTYFPFDGPAGCQHGAELNMQVNGLAGLANGQQFNWLQYFSETGNSGNRQNTIDPPKGTVFNGGLIGDDLPFYSQPMFNGGLGSTKFGDVPFDGLPDTKPHWGSVSFVTFLTSWDGTPPPNANAKETVYVYGAVRWGYRYACPEPPSAVLSLIAIVTTGGCYWLRRRV